MFKIAQALMEKIDEAANLVQKAKLGTMPSMQPIKGLFGAPSVPGFKGSLQMNGMGIPSTFTDYFNRIAKQESSFNPAAVNKYSGATGLYQFMPSTAARYGVTDMNAFKANPELQNQTMYKFTMDNIGIANKKGFNINPNDGIDAREGKILAAMHYGGTGALNNLGNQNYMNRGQAWGHPSIAGYMNSVYRG